MVDYNYVARAIGQAVIQCCSPCRLAGLHAYCPIRGLVIDAAAINPPADPSDEANPPLSFLERAHFPSDPEYQRNITYLLSEEIQHRVIQLFFQPRHELWVTASKAGVRYFHLVRF